MNMHWDPEEVGERALMADWMVVCWRPEGPTERQEEEGGEVREAAETRVVVEEKGERRVRRRGRRGERRGDFILMVMKGYLGAGRVGG